MIKATICDKFVHVDGHAPREPGAPENLVCAAVSALVQTTQVSLNALVHADTPNYDEASGHIWFDIEGGDSPGATLLLQALVIGLEEIGESHPGTIQVYCSGLQ